MEFYGWHLGRLLHYTFILVSLQAAQKTVCVEKIIKSCPCHQANLDN